MSANQVFGWRKQYREGLLCSNERRIFLPVAVTHSEDSKVEERTFTVSSAAGAVQVRMPRGEVVIEGGVDIETLRMVHQCLSHWWYHRRTQGYGSPQVFPISLMECTA